MPIFFRGKSENRKLPPQDFDNEDDLQKLLAESPDLLMDDDEPTVALVQREVSIGDAGYLDLLLVDSEGRPTAVEVKLARNSESRRQVVGQVFDYVSALTLKTVDELDQAVDGKLETALRSFSHQQEDDGPEFEKRWQACGTYLRSGQVRVVVVVDSAPEDLVRIIRFINDHSDLDVRLVSTRKYLTDSDEVILVPNLLVYGGKQSTRPVRTVRPKLQEVVDAYNPIAPKGFETRGKGTSYRLIYPQEWPWQIHYEFLDSGDEFGVHIHLEGDNVRPLADKLKTFENIIASMVPNGKVQWDPRWSKGRGALEINFNQSAPADEIAKTMKSLIEQTKDTIDEELKKIL